MSNSQAPLSAVILIVEDDMMLAMLLEDQLSDLGYRSIKAARVAAGLSIATSIAIDAAILDVNVAGEQVYSVAEVLQERGIPFAFATGYGNGGLKAEFRDSPTLAKPYYADELERIITKLLTPAAPSS